MAYDVEVYLVLDDFGKTYGRAYREVHEDRTRDIDIIDDMLSGQYEAPVRIVSFNTEEGWSRDVSEDIARAVWDRAGRDGIDLLPAATKAFVNSLLSDSPSIVPAVQVRTNTGMVLVQNALERHGIPAKGDDATMADAIERLATERDQLREWFGQKAS